MADDRSEDEPTLASEIVPKIEKQVEREPPDASRRLPEPARRDALPKDSGATISISHSSWDGDYPPPAVLEGYESVQPGLADRIFRMTEIELAHRHEMEKRQAAYLAAGQMFGFILAIVAIAGSVFLIHEGHKIEGGLLGAAVIIPLVALFVRGQFGRGSEDEADG